jgi:ADP-ribosyl-[dinitrogen reductase] hydrolase
MTRIFTNQEREMAGAAGLFAVSERRIAIELESNESHLSQEPLMKDRLVGILLGTAVGDALGLPAEGLSPRRRRRLMPGPWRHRLVFGRGMMSDDTEHTLFVAQSLLEHADNAEAFQRRLAWRLRWWFASLPPGIGRATAKACIKLWLGFSPKRSGVFSAGNGPAMRSAMIGGFFYDSPDEIDRFVRASTQLTHTDPKAVVGALAIARMAACAVSGHPERAPYLAAITETLIRLAPDDAEWQKWVKKMPPALTAGNSMSQFARELDLERGVTGYIYHTVPIAVYAWLRHYGDFRATVVSALDCGGDADTVGAIAGALVGATVGGGGIPSDWLDGIVDWPRSMRVLRNVAGRLDDQRHGTVSKGKVSYFWPAVLPRNLVLLVIVLIHGFRRLAPPY